MRSSVSTRRGVNLRAIASEFPFIHAAQRILDDARTDDFVQGQRNIPLILLKKVDAIALYSVAERVNF